MSRIARKRFLDFPPFGFSVKSIFKCICPGFSKAMSNSLAEVSLGLLLTWVKSIDSNKPAWMGRLAWIFAVDKCYNGSFHQDRAHIKLVKISIATALSVKLANMKSTGYNNNLKALLPALYNKYHKNQKVLGQTVLSKLCRPDQMLQYPAMFRHTDRLSNGVVQSLGKTKVEVSQY